MRTQCVLGTCTTNLLPRAVIENFVSLSKSGVIYSFHIYQNVKTFLFHLMISPRNKATIPNSSLVYKMLFSGTSNEFRGTNPEVVQQSLQY